MNGFFSIEEQAKVKEIAAKIQQACDEPMLLVLDSGEALVLRKLIVFLQKRPK